ncbi:DUF3895 domain-containing protein [Paenibacillus oralis]|uniref:DUF3895 domain-containing protein n=1 Tax=Paenibacillus oralis TaxID=2490856 RepID=A0A3P3TEG7_9BACL|nr:DUF3895 domain-containing protein [Paenibacillus oralis]RRJ54823.1 DUF3895 domain-containing protein [Paenibacillus oralis]
MPRKEIDLYEGATLFDEPIPVSKIREQDADNALNTIELKCLEHLHAGEESVRAICERLIEEGVIPEDRFLTGKPKFYPEICIFLSSLSSADKVWKIAITQDDCRFKLFE